MEKIMASDGNSRWQHVGKSDSRRMRIPFRLLPSNIASSPKLDRRLSLVREVETEVDTNLRRAERLRQATLQKAFAGASFAR